MNSVFTIEKEIREVAEGIFRVSYSRPIPISYPGDAYMELRFRYGKVESDYQYQDVQLANIEILLDDEQIRQRLSPSYKSCQSGFGRPPIDPVIGYKAHLLYFLKRDIISFNELPRQVNKDADYQYFCRCLGVEFTAAYLSLFRKHHLTDEMAQQLHGDILTALDISASTDPLRIGIWDSVPMPSYTSPQKDTKHCDCQRPCDCVKHFSDVDAQVGWQRPTLTKKDKFVGYRKHPIFSYDADKNHRLPLATAVEPADQADINVIEKVLEQCYAEIDILLVDQAIYDFEQIIDWYTRYQVLILVDPKCNAVLDQYPLSETKTPCCPQMEQPLTWSHFDTQDQVQVYQCDAIECIHQFTCPRQFEIPMVSHPAVLGVFPPHSRCGAFLLSLRGLIEPEFGVQTLWSRLKRLPFRGLATFKLLGQLCDTTRLLQKLTAAMT